MTALGYKECKADVVAKIDRIVVARRLADPTNTFSRSMFVREAVTRALANLEGKIQPAPKVRERARATHRAGA